MSWRIEWERRASEDLRRLAVGNPDQARRILDALEALAEQNQGDVKRLQGRPGEYRLRVGQWRVLFRRDVTAGCLIVTYTDKDFALTDATSFVVMERSGIVHFAG